jgi:hypothetical protein
MRDRRKIGELISHDIEVGDLIDFIAQDHVTAQLETPESVA